jgi:hypothetical protein
LNLVEIFHYEMIGLAYKQVELMAAINQASSDGYTEEDIDHGVSVGTRLIFGMRADYIAQAIDLDRRFDAAKIGDWNTHFAQCGAQKIIEDDLNPAP